MTVVLTVGRCEIELTQLGFFVTSDGAPVPAQVYPPALLTFASKSHARAYAKAIDSDDTVAAHELIARHGRWWRRR